MMPNISLNILQLKKEAEKAEEMSPEELEELERQRELGKNTTIAILLFSVHMNER